MPTHSKTRRDSKGNDVPHAPPAALAPVPATGKDSSLDAAFDDLFGSGPLDFLANCAEAADQNQRRVLRRVKRSDR